MAVFPVFLKLEGRPVLVVGAGPVAAGKVPPLVDAGARVTVVAPDVVGEIAALARASNSCDGRSSLATWTASGRRRRGAARGQPCGRARGRVAVPLRQRRGRPEKRERLCRSHRPEGRRDDRDVNRRRGACARRPDARGARGALARGPRHVDGVRAGVAATLARACGADGASDGRCCSRRSTTYTRESTPRRARGTGPRTTRTTRIDGIGCKRNGHFQGRTRLRVARRRRARRPRPAHPEGSRPPGGRRSRALRRAGRSGDARAGACGSARLRRQRRAARRSGRSSSTGC